jgi:hypothetical protein
MSKFYQPKTGVKCFCKSGIQRDNCPNCEGTGEVIDFKAIRDYQTEKKQLQKDYLKIQGAIDFNG